MDILLWGSIFFAGLLSFFSPCVLPLFPVYFGVLMSERGNRSIKIGKFEIAILPVIRTLLFPFSIRYYYCFIRLTSNGGISINDFTKAKNSAI